MISKGLFLGIRYNGDWCNFTNNDKLVIIVNYFKRAKIPPAINPPTTRRIILFPENTESVYLFQNLSISNRGSFNSLSF